MGGGQLHVFHVSLYGMGLWSGPMTFNDLEIALQPDTVSS